MGSLKMTHKAKKNIFIGVFLLLGLLFVIKFGGVTLLRFYIGAGSIGDCKKIPVLCITPQEEIIDPAINSEYLSGLLPYKLAEVQIRIPKEFKAIEQKVVKEYYKRNRHKYNAATMYLLYKKPNFFINLFPRVQAQGIYDDYEFISRVMYASPADIHNLLDAFFVVMKGIFIPDLGEQNNVKMVKFTSSTQRGVIGYNIGEKENYFSCDIIAKDGFYKIYIKDKAKLLDLEKVFSIVSTIEKID